MNKHSLHKLPGAYTWGPIARHAVTHYCTLYARRNKNVFCSHLNALVSVKSSISQGGVFYALGPACNKHYSPNFSRVVSYGCII